MATKWTKWIVGLSGAVLFSGFVGYISNESTATANATGTGTEPSAQNSNDDQQSLLDQWNADNGGDMAPPQSGSTDEGQSGQSEGGGFRRHGGGGFGTFGGESGRQSDGGTSSGGRMSTRAS